ncbi:hypothetical protein [Photobacterium ganghwense]|nr:hypothetical protein [Photobacterium ganghwense]
MKKTELDVLRARMHDKALQKALDFYRKKHRKERVARCDAD